MMIFRVDANALLHKVEMNLFGGRAWDNPELPYGMIAFQLSKTTAALAFNQPGVEGRRDVLLLEAPAKFNTLSPILGRIDDPRPGFKGRARIRVGMRNEGNKSSEFADNQALVYFATSTSDPAVLNDETKALLRELQYSFRANDQPGFFELSDHAFPQFDFRHGHPDIATREQVKGIRSASKVIAGLSAGVRSSHFRPKRERDLESGERVIYELHIGTFTSGGDFSSAADRLSDVKRIGFTTVQLMPVDTSSGSPSWTYDQARTGAVESETYGGSEGLIKFVERAHELGLEVIIDKQYNHQGPEQDSRARIIPQMFTRNTKWGAGLSGNNVACFPQIVKLIGEELAFWVSHFGVDGFRLDATNRLPWEVHCQISNIARQIAAATGKPLYLLSEYAESEDPKGERVPTGHQYADQPGRLLMKMLSLSKAAHVNELESESSSLLLPMLKAARRGWSYPNVPPTKSGLRGGERSTTLLWNHDWIGNRFGGERINQLISFPLFKTIAVWQIFGQWTPFIFMGTEHYARTPWYFFTGHKDESTRNNTSAYYEEVGGILTLCGGRFHEFAAEARAAGLRDAICFSTDGTLAGIDWKSFRDQTDRLGRPYMDHAKRETFEASKLDWNLTSIESQGTERLFTTILRARQDPRLSNDDPIDTQYKAWQHSERVFLLRRRQKNNAEFLAFINLGSESVLLRILSNHIDAVGLGEGYLISLDDGEVEKEWICSGTYSLLLDTNDERYGGIHRPSEHAFDIFDEDVGDVRLPGNTCLVYSRQPSDSSFTKFPSLQP